MSTWGLTQGVQVQHCSLLRPGAQAAQGLPAAVSPQPSVTSQAPPSLLVSPFKIKHQVVHQEGKALMDMMSPCDTVLCFVECLSDYHLALQSK